MRRPKPKRGDQRIEYAIHYLAQYGFAKPQIRKIIKDLLQLYGRDGWALLEEESYRVVLDKLLEEQAELDEKQEAAAAEEASPQNGMEVSRAHGEAPNESRSGLELQVSVSSPVPLQYILPVPLPPAKGHRLDAAIDHLAQYGFAKLQIRNIINDLLQLYGRDGWLFLEEGSYRIVLNKLLEEQAQENSHSSSPVCGTLLSLLLICIAWLSSVFLKFTS